MEKWGIYRKYMVYQNIYKKPSKGVLRLIGLLEMSGIIYEKEVVFNWLPNNRKRYDYYLSQYDIIIEYDMYQNSNNIDKDAEYTILAIANGVNILRINDIAVHKKNLFDTNKIEYYLNQLIRIKKIKESENNENRNKKYGKLVLCDLNAYNYGLIRKIILMLQEYDDLTNNVKGRKMVKSDNRIYLFLFLFLLLIFIFFYFR